MIRRLPLTLLATLLAGAATPALAKDALSSTYWDAAYLSSEIEGDDSSEKVEAEGFRLGLNLGLMPFLNFTADYDQLRDHQDRTGYGSAGLAYHTQHPEYQFFGGVTYERAEFDHNDAPQTDAEEDGFGVEIGGRYMLPNVELHASYRYLDYGKVDRTELDFKGSRYGVGADVQLCPWWSLVADYRVRQLKVDDSTADYTGFTVGFRRYFVSGTDRGARSGGLLNGLFGGGEEAPAGE